MSPRSLIAALPLLLALAAQAAPPPRLVVLLVVDGLPMRQVQAWRDQFGPDGLRRLLDRGRTYAQAHYEHGHTVTGVGHASLLSGAPPRVHGVISNAWTDPQTLASVYCTQDEAHQYLALPPGKTPQGAGTSPRNLLVQTVGDGLRERDPRAKVIGVSGKDRGAILPAGHRGTAYMYLSESGLFSSSSYYMQQHPAWVKAFNARRPADAYWGRTWTLQRPAADYAADAPDGSPWMRAAGFGSRLPATLGDGLEAKGPRYYADLLTSPFGDQLVLDFARAALANEGLGQDAVPDILAISLSAHDYISHSFGPESRMAHDHLLQLDRLLQAFFAEIDRRVGKDRYVLLLSADHGFTDTPEWAQQQGRAAGRLNPARLLTELNQALAQRFGPPNLARSLSASGVLLNEAAIAQQRLDPEAVALAGAQALRQVEGVAAAYSAAELDGQPPADEAARPVWNALRLARHPERSPRLMFAVRDGWLLGNRMAGATHGNPYASDQHVPILSWGPRWFRAGRVDERVSVYDIAPTVAELLALPPPPQSQGRPLPRGR